MQELDRIYETVLYADNLPAAVDFYQELMGLKLLSQTDLMLVFHVGQNYLLIFDPEKSSIEGRLVPSHGASGAGHIAFTIDAKEMPAWRERFREAGVEVEMEVDWSDGKRGRSIYVRDPANNSVELAPAILWNYLHQETGTD